MAAPAFDQAKQKNHERVSDLELNPATVELEFMGVYGVTAVMILMSLVVVVLESGCNGNNLCALVKTNGSGNESGVVSHLLEFVSDAKEYLVNWVLVDGFISYNVFATYCVYFSWLVALSYLLPGESVKGVKLRDGTFLKYKVNGFVSGVLTVSIVLADAFVNGPSKLMYVADNFKYFVSSTLVFSVLLALAVYLLSFRPVNGTKADDCKGKSGYSESKGALLLSATGNSGYFAYDYFMGRELNPRYFGLDIKYFCELRPGLIGWVLVNIAFIAKHYSNFGTISNAILLATGSQILYVFDALFLEKAVLTTMDITTEGFGFMLSMGDLCWVPAVYTLQARYLAYNNIELSPYFATFVLILSIAGYLIFRLSNLQKNNFRSSPTIDPKLYTYIETNAGSKLLVSGWWGLARHINYTGDWLLGLSQCLATGFGNPLTYFFSLYFLSLLLHRNYRDELKCKNKYGKDWDRYCSIVKYKFIPYLI
ncbi:Delta(14)-sterol reductase [Smittium culicis]|uniref:Delta(14)-sterol reductase n=1 Tax=Smittium culicis TaxID=133412 RepID=A0A1R1YST7_9FUNG|nr:Delta(14)-sterol reductase [Smittium culicis]